MDSVNKSRALATAYGHLDGEALLEPLIRKEFPGKIALVSSFGAESALLLAMAASIDRALPVIFLDTGKLFPETLAYRDLLAETLGLEDVRTIYPSYADTSRQDPDGVLWQNNPNACCYIRKVRPLEKALKGFDAWITGRKRFQGGLRQGLAAIEPFNGRVKINPLASWRAEKIQAAFQERNLPEHPLANQGYLSVGCLPCTKIPSNSDDPRGGRWQGLEKTECGIHLSSAAEIS